MAYQVEDNEDCEVTGRILEVLQDAQQIYARENTGPWGNGWWDGAIDYILKGDPEK